MYKPNRQLAIGQATYVLHCHKSSNDGILGYPSRVISFMAVLKQQNDVVSKWPRSRGFVRRIRATTSLFSIMAVTFFSSCGLCCSDAVFSNLNGMQKHPSVMHVSFLVCTTNRSLAFVAGVFLPCQTARVTIYRSSSPFVISCQIHRLQHWR